MNNKPKAKQEKKTPAVYIRGNVYDLGDALTGLENAASNMQDKELEHAIAQIAAAFSEFKQVINEKYNWD